MWLLFLLLWDHKLFVFDPFFLVSFIWISSPLILMSQDFCSNLFDPFEQLHNIFNICTPWILQTNLWCIWGIDIQVTVEDSHTSSLSKYLQRLTELLMFTLSKEQIVSVSVSSAHLLRLRDRFESLDRDNRGYLRCVDALLTIIIQLNNNNVFIGFVCFPKKHPRMK